MKLEKFDKNKKRKIIVTSVVLGLFLIIGGVYLIRSHAIFEEHKTFDVIFGKVPPFKKKEKDLELAILVDGTSSTEIPEEKDYRVNVECDDENLKVSWDYSKWDLSLSNFTTATTCSIKFNSIYNSIKLNGEEVSEFPSKDNYTIKMNCENTGSYSWDKDTWEPKVSGINKDSTCTLEFDSPTEFYNEASIGDYVAYTPSSTSYEISTDLTGYSSKQEINPSELNLWRVIKKNEDGTIEIVSEYASSKNLFLQGQEGYRRFVGTLNEIASAYKTEGITSGSRHVGGTDEQGTCNAYNTCSDQKTSYTEDTPDTTLIKVAIGSLKATQPDGKILGYGYWLASRHQSSGSSYYGRYVNRGGDYDTHTLAYYSGGDKQGVASLRPIVTLKSGLTATEESKNDKKLWAIN